MSTRQKLQLQDVPETMLWTLYSRASESMRSDGVLQDAKALEIYRSLDYNFRRSFGLANPALALRALAFDDVATEFLQRHPHSAIINLGEGLETQRFRLKGAHCQWFSVDLPESIAIREQFIQPDAEHVHIGMSATDTRWFAQVPTDRPILISAQGLFMYFEESAVRGLLQDIAGHFAHVELVFDVIPRWVSRLSLLAGGLPLTPYYRSPPMPWGVAQYSLKPTLRRWLDRPQELRVKDYPAFPRGVARLAANLFPRLPGARQVMPQIVLLKLL